MLKRKYVVGVSLLAMVLVLGGGLFYYNMVRAQGPGEYNPWYDVTSEVEGVPDGKINIRDIAALASRFGTESSDYFIARAGLTYDSGWVNITDKAGQYFNITHNLNSTDVIVDITGKTTLDGGVHQRNLGLTGYTGWSRTYGGANDDSLFCIIQTGDGGYALAGSIRSSGAGGSDAWLVKSDAFGNLEWNQTYGGTNDDSARSVVQTGDGGYALGGYTKSFGAGDWDFWLVKTDASGEMQWNETYGGAEDDYVQSVVQTGDGGYTLAGYIHYSGTKRDGWMIKTDSTGNHQWNQTYSETSYDYVTCMIQTSDGGYALAGSDQSNFWLIKTNSSGDKEWSRKCGYASYDAAYSMVQTGDGGYALAGRTSFLGGGYDFCLVKTDSTGDEEWKQEYGGAEDDYVQSLVQTSDGGYALAGSTESFGAGAFDFWLVKTDSAGNMQWNKTYGGANDDGLYCIIQTNDGGYALSGYTESFGAGGLDGWLIKTEVESGLAWTDSTADTVTLYRGATDSYWNYVRVRIWKIKETP